MNVVTELRVLETVPTALIYSYFRYELKVNDDGN
jgi:hypothetical protein